MGILATRMVSVNVSKFNNKINNNAGINNNTTCYSMNMKNNDNGNNNNDDTNISIATAISITMVQQCLIAPNRWD